MDPEETIKELEEDIDVIEHDFQEVKDDNAEGTLREKQQQAEKLLEEIHGQLRFLEEQVKQKE